MHLVSLEIGGPYPSFYSNTMWRFVLQHLSVCEIIIILQFTAVHCSPSSSVVLSYKSIRQQLEKQTALIIIPWPPLPLSALIIIGWLSQDASGNGRVCMKTQGTTNNFLCTLPERRAHAVCQYQFPSRCTNVPRKNLSPAQSLAGKSE